MTEEQVLEKLQRLICSTLVFGEPMLKRKLMREVHAERFGTTLWNLGYVGLIKNHIITESGEGTKESPKKVTKRVSFERLSL